jgi:hypothetical protein
MRATFIAFSLALLALMFGDVSANAEKVRCSAIRDSALCLAEPTCWFNAAENKGCVDGPPPAQDACGVHGGESICVSDTALGCAWNADDKKCVTKAN